MAGKAYARRYAEAVFEIALEKNEPDRWQSDLEKIASLGDDAVIVSALEGPGLTPDNKTKLLSENLSEINPLALNLVYLLIARGRLNIAGEIADEYGQLLDRHNGIERAEVITAVPLEDEDVKKLEERLGAIVNKKVIVKSQVDPEVLGGIKVRIGSQLLDGSTRSRLESLKRVLGGQNR